MLRVVIFDWGDTLMRDLPGMEGPMASWPTVELIEGAPQALGALDPQLVRCVASNAGVSDARLMAMALERGGIREFFQHFFTSRELGSAKPDVRFFLEIARRVGASPHECVMVGNDYDKDIAGARRAGMHTIWLAAGSPPPGPRDCADAVIASMAELPAAISALQSGHAQG